MGTERRQLRQRTECGREELPPARGQGWRPGGPHARGVAAKRSYPMSEVRGGGRDCQAVTAQEQRRGATPPQRPGAEAGRTLCPRGGGREELPHTRGQGRWSGVATSTPRPGAAAGRSNATFKERWLRGAGGPRGATPRSRSGRASVRRYPLSKVRSSGCTLLKQP